jgi:hypothetical protein
MAVIQRSPARRLGLDGSQQYRKPGPPLPQAQESFQVPAAVCNLALSPSLFHTYALGAQYRLVDVFVPLPV